MADSNKSSPSSVTFHYSKSSYFRVIHADGIIGCVTPRALIHCAIFSERQAIPQTITQEVSPEGIIGEVTGHTGKEGIVRELEADVLMNLDTAKALHKWIGDRVKEFQNAIVRFSAPKETAQ